MENNTQALISTNGTPSYRAVAKCWKMSFRRHFYKPL